MPPIQPCLTSMPWHISDRILDELDLKAKIRLGKTCPILHSIVKQSRIPDISIRISFFESQILIEYRENDRECGGARYNNAASAITDLKFFFSNPKVHIRQFVVHFDSEERFLSTTLFQEIRNLLSHQNHQLSVSLLWFLWPVSLEEIMSILPYVTPGVLKSISINFPNPMDNWKVAANTEQWKNTSYLRFRNVNLPISFFVHSPRADFECKSVSLKELKQVLQAASNFPNHEVYSFNIFASSLHPAIFPYLNRYKPRYEKWNRSEDRPVYYYMGIPGTDYKLEVKHKETHLLLRKVKRGVRLNL